MRAESCRTTSEIHITVIHVYACTLSLYIRYVRGRQFFHVATVPLLLASDCQKRPTAVAATRVRPTDVRVTGSYRIFVISRARVRRETVDGGEVSLSLSLSHSFIHRRTRVELQI